MTRQTLYRARFVLPISSLLIEDGGVLVENGHIRAVGSYRELAAAHPGAAGVDFGETVLLPPMVNAHTHLELSDFADWAAAAGEPDAPRTFVDWILWLVRIRRRIDIEQLKTSLSHGLKVSLLAGSGAVGDIFTTFGAATAYHHSPLRGRIFAEVLGHDSGQVADRLEEIIALVQALPGPFLEWGLSPHAPYTLSPTAMSQVFAMAREHGWPCSMHLAESADETAFLADGSGAIANKLYASAKWDPSASIPPGCSPVAMLCRQGRLKRGDMAVHGVQVDASDIALLKNAGCSVALCPRSNASLNVGKAPLSAYLEAGIALALGTDSLASSASLSIWDEMAFASAWFAGVAEPRTWLEIATFGGAKALGLEKRMGHLAPGCEASFQIVSLPHLPSKPELEEALCVSGEQVKVLHLYLAAENALPES